MSEFDKVVVVGASLAGLRAAQTLRSEGFAGELVVVGAETHLPYNRPPLSKGVLDGDDEVALPGNEEIEGDLLSGREAVGLDIERKTVLLENGERLPYDGLVIATGARPRRLPEQQMAFKGVHALRTIDDALSVRAALKEGPRHVVVVGGGIIGGEIASTLRAQGRSVTLVYASTLPMKATLGDVAGRWLARRHEQKGVEVISGARVVGAEGTDKVSAVRLDDGSTVPANLVIVGMGVLPNIEWLKGTALGLDGGVETNSRLFALREGNAVDDIVAAGDVARWPHAVFGDELVRIEHWANANEQGAVAARNLLRGPSEAEPYQEIHSLGTRVHGARIQWAGMPWLGDGSRVVTGDPEDDKFAIAFTRGGVLIGAVAVDSPKELIRLRRTIAARESLPAVA
jgi:NADPH-dependent 2,4-dienoyl-CoA reductase/sulfur reductase-like enzyme